MGRNGSGKSNIIKALEFVLTDVRETNTQRYAHFRMNPRERTEVEVVIVDYREDDEVKLIILIISFFFFSNTLF